MSGLTTALLLLKQGVAVTLYEATAQEGGLAGSYHSEGFIFDFGPHEFCTNNPALHELLRSVCGDDLLEIEKCTAQYFNGRYVRYPFEIADVLKNVSPLLCVRALFEVGLARLRNLFKKPPDDSFKAWAYSRYGKTLYEMYFGPYTEKVWGIDPTQLDPRTASQRITVDSVWDLIRRTVGYNLFGMEDFERAHSEFRRGFYYVRGGIGMLQTHLRRAVEEHGGRLVFDKRLTGVTRGPAAPPASAGSAAAGDPAVGGPIEALHFEDGSRAEGFDAVVSTIPLPVLIDITLGEAGRALARVNRLPFRAMVFVFLRVDKPKVLDYHWTYYPDLDIPFQRATEFVHFGADMTPPTRTGMTLEIACDKDDATWQRTDEQILDDCLVAMERLDLLTRDEVLGADIVRVPYVYPLQVMNFLEKADALLEGLAEVPNVVSIGRQGLFRYCNMNECMEMAIDVVPRLMAGETSIRCTTTGTWQGAGVIDTPDAVTGGVQTTVQDTVQDTDTPSPR